MTLTDGIEISYNSAGVLAHMVSDGDEAWVKLNASRQEVMTKIIKVFLDAKLIFFSFS